MMSLQDRMAEYFRINFPITAKTYEDCERKKWCGRNYPDKSG